MSFYGLYFRTARGILRLFNRPKSPPDPQSVISPAVYVVHHQNMRGPIFTVMWFPKNLRVWVLHVFTTFKGCYRHFVDFTLTKRNKMPGWLAKIFAVPEAALFSALLRSGGAIPVYRGSPKIRNTMSLSVEALKRGESVVIFPDIDYTSQSENIGEIYTGFLQLERFYFKSEKKHVSFVPMAVDFKKRGLSIGEPVSFMDGEDFNEGKIRVSNELRSRINGLSKSDAS